VTARLRKLIADLSDVFWMLPAAMVVAGVLLAEALVTLDRAGLPAWLTESGWTYTGGGTGARTLLGVVASSTIGVAGTVFSITIAALTLAAGQMGPRLLRNFTRDRGNQATLGTFLGSFAYALTVLASVRTSDEGTFVPHAAMSVAIGLALLSVAMLVFFVGHMAGRINVDTVIVLVSQDLEAAMQRLSADVPQSEPPPVGFWDGATAVTDPRSGYLQEIDVPGLADWAAGHGTAIRLLVGPGDYAFPGAPIALVQPATEGVEAAIRDATALGRQRLSSADLEFALRHLVEVAVRALSPGINDPHTAISVLDRLGAALCDMSKLQLASAAELRDGKPVLVVPSTDYDGLADAMFHMIRQNGQHCPAVLIRMLDVLTFVLSCEQNPTRVATLQRHADLVLDDAGRNVTTPTDLADIAGRHARFHAVRQAGAVGFLHGQAG
jgi:uncharacterized membrane protein